MRRCFSTRRTAVSGEIETGINRTGYRELSLCGVWCGQLLPSSEPAVLGAHRGIITRRMSHKWLVLGNVGGYKMYRTCRAIIYYAMSHESFSVITLGTLHFGLAEQCDMYKIDNELKSNM